MGFEGSAPGLVEKLLNRAKDLMSNYICTAYRMCLEKAQEVFLELSKRVSEMPICLAAIARKHKLRGLVNPMKGSQIQMIVE
ncbi:3259_t:CDS:2, partial [Dentiscutata erythropus]